jgi:hypothetical protein
MPHANKECKQNCAQHDCQQVSPAHDPEPWGKQQWYGRFTWVGKIALGEVQGPIKEGLNESRANFHQFLAVQVATARRKLLITTVLDEPVLTTTVGRTGKRTRHQTARKCSNLCFCGIPHCKWYPSVHANAIYEAQCLQDVGSSLGL